MSRPIDSQILKQRCRLGPIRDANQPVLNMFIQSLSTRDLSVVPGGHCTGDIDECLTFLTDLYGTYHVDYTVRLDPACSDGFDKYWKRTGLVLLPKLCFVSMLQRW